MSEKYGAELLPFQGLLGPDGYHLTTAKSIAILGSAAIGYFKRTDEVGTWKNFYTCIPNLSREAVSEERRLEHICQTLKPNLNLRRGPCDPKPRAADIGRPAGM